eukprot:323801-Chlamydomonas_euryale.AAC.4
MFKIDPHVQDRPSCLRSTLTSKIDPHVPVRRPTRTCGVAPACDNGQARVGLTGSHAPKLGDRRISPGTPAPPLRRALPGARPAVAALAPPCGGGGGTPPSSETVRVAGRCSASPTRIGRGDGDARCGGGGGGGSPSPARSCDTRNTTVPTPSALPGATSGRGERRAQLPPPPLEVSDSPPGPRPMATSCWSSFRATAGPPGTETGVLAGDGAPRAEADRRAAADPTASG